jgi:hypothetical protein
MGSAVGLGPVPQHRPAKAFGGAVEELALVRVDNFGKALQLGLSGGEAPKWSDMPSACLHRAARKNCGHVHDL